MRMQLTLRVLDDTAVLGGTFGNWHVKIDDGAEATVVGDTTVQSDSSSTYIGEHKIVAYAANARNERINIVRSGEISAPF